MIAWLHFINFKRIHRSTLTFPILNHCLFTFMPNGSFLIWITLDFRLIHSNFFLRRRRRCMRFAVRHNEKEKNQLEIHHKWFANIEISCIHILPPIFILWIWLWDNRFSLRFSFERGIKICFLSFSLLWGIATRCCWSTILLSRGVESKRKIVLKSSPHSCCYYWAGHFFL